MLTPVFTKDPDDISEFALEWAEWLPAGDSVDSEETVTTAPSGITLADQFVSDAKTVVQVSGGTHGTDYTFLTRMVTANGLSRDQSFIVRVRSR